MTTAAKQVVRQALALPEKERVELMSLLFESLNPADEKLTPKEWSRAWKAELEKRIEEVRSGKVKTIPAARVMAELKAKYG